MSRLPKGDRPLTPAEKQRAYRERQKQPLDQRLAELAAELKAARRETKEARLEYKEALALIEAQQKLIDRMHDNDTKQAEIESLFKALLKPLADAGNTAD